MQTCLLLVHRLTVILAGLLFAGIAQANLTAESSTAELVFTSAEGGEMPALLLDTGIESEVSGLVATVTIHQRYRNVTDDWVNGSYRFPLPQDAAVDSLVLETGGRILRGVVKQKKIAKQEFDAAKTAGKKAGLLVQHRPNLFSMSLANIAPQAEVKATISFVSTVKYERGAFSLRLPTTLTPRFIPGSPLDSEFDSDGLPAELQTTGNLEIGSGDGWALNTDQVPDASDITPPQTGMPEHPGSHQFSLSLLLSAGMTLADINSVSHAIDVVDNGKGQQLITLTNDKENLDRDLILHWMPASNHAPEAAVFRQQGEDANHSLVMLMPPTKNIVATLPREVIFIIDSSGSMAGVSMLQAQQGLQAALNLLAPGDRFNVIDFDSGATALFSQTVPAIPANRTSASRFVNNLVADGGTNMDAALELAFAMPAEEGLLRQIVFITDGSVGNEQALFDKINRQLGQARLFTVGIGSAPNAHFMRGAARFGRGSYQFISDIALASQSMRELFQRLNRPVMKGLAVQIDGVAEHDIYPNPVPDLYLGQPLMLTVKSARPIGQITLSGELAGESWNRTIDAGNAPEARNIGKLWARTRVEQLQSDVVTGRLDAASAKQQITETGLEYQLVTRHTSFLAVEEKPSKPAELEAKQKSVPNLMPAGNTMPVPIPNTATPATLLSLLGGFMMLCSSLLLFRRKAVKCQ